MNNKARLVLVLLALALPADASDLQRLDRDNYDRSTPAGKEVDAIIGDFVLSNDHIIAVVAAPGEHRDANLTVRNVGGSVIDLTRADLQSDQLSCFYPGGGKYRFTEKIDWPKSLGAPPPDAAALAFRGHALKPVKNASTAAETIVVGYELRPGEDFLRISTVITNQGDSTMEVRLRDGVRADKEFSFGLDKKLNLWWAQDEHWRQAYGLQAENGKRRLRAIDSRNARKPRQIAYQSNKDKSDCRLEPGASVTWRRRLFPGADTFDIKSVARKQQGMQQTPVRFCTTDKNGFVPAARVQVNSTAESKQLLGVGHTNKRGVLQSQLPPGDYTLRVVAQGHDDYVAPFSHPRSVSPDATTIEIGLSEPAIVQAVITDGLGNPIPAKVQFIGLDQTPSPNFGPDSAVRGVANLQYTPDGRFRTKLTPGRYRWLASYGPEHDAAEGELDVAAGETAMINAALSRSVDTTGWISSELHSHSSPSGDNTASQRGRVLNLLAEHLEFCPCTEHQRIDVYDEHLSHFDAMHRMLTCPGIELTGRPLPLNHQNAFPLALRKHEQFGGAPLSHPDPAAQIKRLASWDNYAEKVVQTNHPNIAQMVGDRDLDGTADEGFEEMFGYMDVIEVHPPGLIFESLGSAGELENGVGSGGWEGRGNAIVNWLQLLNLGYRLTGVVNTDAHYNNHGSGWLRNWVRCSTDDPAKASVAELVHEFEHGHVVMSNGPFLRVEAAGETGSAIPGDDLSALDGNVLFRVRVQCPNWLVVNRVQFFINGRASKEHNYTVRRQGDMFSTGSKVFEQEIPLRLEQDAHVVVAVCGEDRQLGAIYGDKSGAAMPVAVANPIYVDIDGDKDNNGIAFEWNKDGLGAPLPRLDRKPSHGHDHANHRH